MRTVPGEILTSRYIGKSKQALEDRFDGNTCHNCTLHALFKVRGLSREHQVIRMQNEIRGGVLNKRSRSLSCMKSLASTGIAS
jgi:hypothetical protein